MASGFHSGVRVSGNLISPEDMDYVSRLWWGFGIVPMWSPMSNLNDLPKSSGRNPIPAVQPQLKTLRFYEISNGRQLSTEGGTITSIKKHSGACLALLWQLIDGIGSQPLPNDDQAKPDG